MNRDNVIRMAREACDKDKVDAWHNGFWTLTQEELERFAQDAYAAGAAAEREACAYRAGIALLGADRGLASRVDQAIRARGQA